jgi:predicted GIY-YIG superfamily endonuclease
MAVYLICFERPYPAGMRPRHYLGYAADVEARIALHRKGKGSRLLSVVNRAGISWEVVRVWPDGTQQLERRLKRHRNLARLCPCCKRSALDKHNHRRRIKKQKGDDNGIPQKDVNPAHTFV